MTPTTLISVRGRDRDELLADPNFVYVGRGVYRGDQTWKPSPFGNPFRVGMKRRTAVRILGRDIDCEPRAETLNARLCQVFYHRWVVGSGLDVRQLRGKVLGCWCGDWTPGRPGIPCHAVILALIADAPTLPGLGAGESKESDRVGS